MVLGLLVAAGCSAAGNGGVNGSFAPPASPSEPTSAPAATPTTLSANGTATPFPTISTVAIADPPLILNLPSGWTELPVESYRTLIENTVAAHPSFVDRAGLVAHLADLDAGLVRLVLIGPSGSPPWTPTLVIEVDHPAASLDAAVARIDRRFTAFGGIGSTERSAVTLAAGQGIRRAGVHPLPSPAPSGSVPAQSIEYIVQLADGRVLWLFATAPAASLTFPGTVHTAAITLRPR
jgi:hypothetical protein